MAKQEDFQLKESARELRLATTQLRDFNQSAGVEIAKTVGTDLKKGIIDPFTNTFAQIPGVSTLGAVGKTLFNKTFSALKARNERRLLIKQLDITEEQFKQLQVQKKVADAQKKSEIMKGEGDGERNKIFADAFGQDPEFFAFYRSMQAYGKAFNAGETSMILSPDSEFFKFFGNIKPKAE